MGSERHGKRGGGGCHSDLHAGSVPPCTAPRLSKGQTSGLEPPRLTSLCSSLQSAQKPLSYEVGAGKSGEAL